MEVFRVELLMKPVSSHQQQDGFLSPGSRLTAAASLQHTFPSTRNKRWYFKKQTIGLLLLLFPSGQKELDSVKVSLCFPVWKLSSWFGCF